MEKCIHSANEGSFFSPQKNNETKCSHLLTAKLPLSLRQNVVASKAPSASQHCSFIVLWWKLQSYNRTWYLFDDWHFCYSHRFDSMVLSFSQVTHTLVACCNTNGTFPNSIKMTSQTVPFFSPHLRCSSIKKHLLTTSAWLSLNFLIIVKPLVILNENNGRKMLLP